MDDILSRFEPCYSSGRYKDIIGWKKAYSYIDNEDTPFRFRAIEVIVKLIIPKDAGVVFTYSKCRASYARVEGIYKCIEGHYLEPSEDEALDIKTAVSGFDHSFSYTTGHIVRPDCFDSNYRVECSYGINFFRTYKEAVKYIP